MSKTLSGREREKRRERHRVGGREIQRNTDTVEEYIFGTLLLDNYICGVR